MDKWVTWMLSLKVLAKDGAQIRYGIYDEAGHLVKSVERDCTAEIEESQRRHIALATILKRIEGVDGVISSEFAHTHEEFGWPVPEHPHPPHSHEPHEHPSVLPPHDHKHDHPPHEHEVPAHGHAAIDIRLLNVESLSEAQTRHGHPLQEHGHNELVSFEQRLNLLAQALSAVGGRLDSIETMAKEHNHPLTEHDHTHEHGPHEHEFPAHEHPAKAHGHPEITNLISDKPPIKGKRPPANHVHRFDTMVEDGRGWVCGLCGMSKEEAGVQ